MGRLLIKYLGGQFLIRAVFITIGLSGILSLFDLLANAGDVTANRSDIFQPLLSYMMLRYPEILNIVLPLSALIACLTIINQKVANMEMIGLRAAGISVYQILLSFIAGGVVLACLQFFVITSFMPDTSYRLHLWSETDYIGAPPDRRMKDQIPNWIASGDTIIRLEAASADGTVLTGLSVITRKDSGVMQDFFTAGKAIYRDGAWYLEQVAYPNLPQRDLSTAKIVLNLPIKPGFFAKTVDTPSALTLSELLTLAQDDVVIENPPYVYRVWIYQKFAAPAALLVMILLCMPAALQLARKDSLMRNSFAVIAAGFCFLILMRLVATLGESGYVPPLLATFSPHLIFTFLVIWILVLREE